MATGPLRIVLVVVGLVIGAFVLANAFPTGEATVAPDQGSVETPSDDEPPQEEPPPADQETGDGDGGQQGQPDAQGVRIQVLNGTEESGLAERTATRVEALGFEEVLFGDAETITDDTGIFYKPEFREQARELREQLFEDATLQTATADSDFDVTVVLGTNYTRAGN